MRVFALSWARSVVFGGVQSVVKTELFSLGFDTDGQQVIIIKAGVADGRIE